MIPPVVKHVVVKAAPDAAFRRFTAELASWWPLGSHPIGQDQSETVVMEARVGGRIVERIRDGRECTWGTVTAWDPPRRVAFTWHPGEAADRAGVVEIRFAATGDGTRVELTHSGFERLGRIGPRVRRAYGLGWPYVLGLYAERRNLMMFAVGGLTRAVNLVRRLRRPKRANLA